VVYVYCTNVRIYIQNVALDGNRIYNSSKVAFCIWKESQQIYSISVTVYSAIFTFVKRSLGLLAYTYSNFILE
jgi:hypothetical protein